MFWVGLDVVRQEFCFGQEWMGRFRFGLATQEICKGVERFDEVWSHPAGNVQRLRRRSVG
jgi:hypothetical protein